MIKTLSTIWHLQMPSPDGQILPLGFDPFCRFAAPALYRPGYRHPRHLLEQTSNRSISLDQMRTPIFAPKRGCCAGDLCDRWRSTGMDVFDPGKVRTDGPRDMAFSLLRPLLPTTPPRTTCAAFMGDALADSRDAAFMAGTPLSIWPKPPGASFRNASAYRHRRGRAKGEASSC
jgi:hypothetical protein